MSQLVFVYEKKTKNVMD